MENKAFSDEPTFNGALMPTISEDTTTSELDSVSLEPLMPSYCPPDESSFDFESNGSETGAFDWTERTQQFSPIDFIRQGVDGVKNELSSSETDAKKEDGEEDSKKKSAKDKEKIRIVIRDAKPPMGARVLQFLMRVICLILIIAVCGIGIPRLFGINEFNVLTASMYPTYPVGSLVFVQPKDPTTIRPGEVVTVIMNEDLDMVTHRVVENNYDEKTLTTKGDANNAEDSPSLYENVVGVVVFSLPFVGGFVDYLTNDATGRVLGIGIVLSILALTFIAEAICFLLTKQAASVYKPDGSKQGEEKQNDEDYNIKAVNSRKVDKEFKRGKGMPVESVPLSTPETSEEGNSEGTEPEEQETEIADQNFDMTAEPVETEMFEEELPQELQQEQEQEQQEQFGPMGF